MQLAISLCASGRLHYVSPTRCKLRKAHVAPDEDEWWCLDLDDYILPATGLVPQCKLSGDHRLAVATVLAIDAYLCTADAAKGTHRTIATMASTIAKFWEWGRLNGIYRPEDWISTHFRRLEKQLAKGRWSVALRAKPRVRSFLDSEPLPEAIARIDSVFGIRMEMSELMGTNLVSQELACARGEIHKYVQPVAPERGWEKSTDPPKATLSWLAQAFWAANLLASVPAPYAFKLTPFPEPFARAKTLAVPNARTPTLSVDQAIGLLIHSLKYIHEYSTAICDLVYEVGRIGFELTQADIGSKHGRRAFIERQWNQSTVKAHAEDLLGVEVTIASTRGSTKVSVPRLVNMLMCASVVLIAGFNGRRKDEIIHRALGLRRDSIKAVNEELGVYEGTFYVEKTLKSYAPYFVNQTTFDAYSSLKSLERAQLSVEELHAAQERSEESLSHSMFWSRSWGQAEMALQPRVWFNFTFSSGRAGREFTEGALGEGLALAGGGAHVFRRFYAIIYFYRFEHGGLLALRYQLGHANCETTVQYVTNAMIDAVEARMPIGLRRSREDVRASMDRDWRDLDAAIREVGSEKLHSVLVELLGGQTFSGGFPRLVERLHRKFLANLDYSKLDADRQATRLRDVMVSRGHALRPLPHADCAAGTSKARGAKCAEENGSGPAPENASAKTCSGCPYSWTSQGHVDGLKLDLEVLNHEVTEAPEGSLLRDRRVVLRDNLQQAIWLHEARINRN